MKPNLPVWPSLGNEVGELVGGGRETRNTISTDRHGGTLAGPLRLAFQTPLGPRSALANRRVACLFGHAHDC